MSYAITYMWNLKKLLQMDSFTKQKNTHRHRKQTYGYKVRTGGVCALRGCHVSFSGSSVHGTSQARILERGAISYSRGSSWHGVEPMSLASQVLLLWVAKCLVESTSRGAMETWIQIRTQHLPVVWTSPLFLVICKTVTDQTKFVYMKQKTQITMV